MSVETERDRAHAAIHAGKLDLAKAAFLRAAQQADLERRHGTAESLRAAAQEIEGRRG